VEKCGITVDTPEEAERFFFALHTYFALLVKLIAWLALSRHLGPKVGVPLFSTLQELPSEELRERLREMEQGGIFRAYGIENLLEGDFFAWYLYGWGERMEEAIRGLIRRLSEYDPTTLSIDPEETRDLLKKLYHYLLPREVRHNLGEPSLGSGLAIQQAKPNEVLGPRRRRGTGLAGTHWPAPAYAA